MCIIFVESSLRWKTQNQENFDKVEHVLSVLEEMEDELIKEGLNLKLCFIVANIVITWISVLYVVS